MLVEKIKYKNKRCIPGGMPTLKKIKKCHALFYDGLSRTCIFCDRVGLFLLFIISCCKLLSKCAKFLAVRHPQMPGQWAYPYKVVQNSARFVKSQFCSASIKYIIIQLLS